MPSRYRFAMLPQLARLALPRLAVRPDQQLLEIGCGNGTTATAVAQLLTSGHILAIDRAGAKVTAARQRAAAHIARGVADVEQSDLSDLVVEDASLDTVFALNVNLFQTGEVAIAERIRRALRRRGRLVLGHGRRDGHGLAQRAEQTCAVLRAGGLGDTTVDWATPEHLFLTAVRR
jgi:ubiquinone/menaquinone biosynthesis C-methylase UbiE